MSGVTECTGFCAGEGAACGRALDCCDLNCNDGVCGGEICKVESDPCEVAAECCSNICEGGQCQLDPANTECRGTGETCTSGPQRGCCSMVCDEATDRCAFGAETCAAQGGACAVDGDCCRGVCDDGSCVTPCMEDGATCQANTDCCSGTCGADGMCAPSAGCAPIGELCATDAECCSSLCFGGRCDQVVVN